jgi:XTP/dITP diphosphohydrolase
VKPAPDHRLILATHNEHKVRELGEILDSTGALGPLRIVGAGTLGLGEPTENGTSFQANALIKARYVAQATGLPAAADDSGLCVAVMGGAPGICSARWSGRHGDDGANQALLLDQLSDIGGEDRAAWFECAAALVLPDGTEHVATGRMPGRLTFAPQGLGGFGYDPILVPDGYSVTSAQLTPEEKNAISHRGKAFRALAPRIRAIWDVSA